MEDNPEQEPNIAPEIREVPYIRPDAPDDTGKDGLETMESKDP